MATEAPLFHDGSQTTAAVDLSVNLIGPAGSGQFLCVDITGDRQVNVQQVAGSRIYGILQNAPTGSQAADVGFLGVSKAVAGGTFAAGDTLVCDAQSRVVKKSFTGLQYAVGRAITASTAINQIVTILVNPSTVSSVN